MGNMISPCCRRRRSCSMVKLIFWEGNTSFVKGKRVAGEIMFQFPDRMVCDAASFFIGHPIPSLSINNELVPGKTYFVLPLDFSCNVLSLSFLSAAALASTPSKRKANFNNNECPFEYMKGSNGRLLIRVQPEFIINLLTTRDEKETNNSGHNHHGFLCSTPELKKQYDQLVGSRDQVWSPKLETISEYKIRYSPCKLIGLEWKQKECEG